MKAAFFVLLLLVVQTVSAQTANAPRICITKMCNGTYANKSEILDLKRVLVRSDTLTIDKFVFGTNMSGYCAFEVHNNGNMFNDNLLKVINKITTTCKIYFVVDFISTTGKKYTYNYFFIVKAK